jgi:hypothetical protein
MRITVEFEGGTSRTYENAQRITDCIQAGIVTVITYDTTRRCHDVHTLPLTNVAAWTEEPE